MQYKNTVKGFDSMKKITRILVSLLLVAVLVANLGVCSFAKDKLVYTCIGDSNSAGYGTTGYVYSRIPAPNAYHSLVANGLGAELRDFGSGGFRSFEIRYMLDPDFEMDWNYSTICNTDVAKETMDSYKEDYIKAITDADYITIQVGSNDIMGDDLGFAMLELYTPVQQIEDLKAKIDGTGSFDETLVAVLDALATTVQYVKFASSFYTRVQQSYTDFYENWDAIIKNIYRLNPDAHIIALSAINSFNNTSIFEWSPVKTGKLLDIIFNKLNDWIENGSEYADTYDYCDISDLVFGELALTQDDFWDVYLPKVHPDDAQHKEITDRILAIIEAE